MTVTILWNARDWAAAIAELPAGGPLPCRTALVPHGAMAHALRRELIAAGRGDALAGTRFILTSQAAVDTLRAAETPFRPGEEALRPTRLATLFHSDLTLAHFPLDLLRSTPGWENAFAHAISDLEGAGVHPEDLEALAAEGQLRDVAAIWRALDQSAGRSWTAQRIYAEAAVVLERRPEAWPFQGAAIAPAASGLTAAEARFLRAIPNAAVGLLAARPGRRRYFDRIEAILGPEAAAALRAARARRTGGSERDLVVSYLFEPPAVLADPLRARSQGPDGSVDLEEYAGVDAELEAAVDWVARQVLDGIPVEEIAVLVPEPDPLAGLLAERLARLPWPEPAFPVHVAGGLPLAGFAAGARALAVVRALRSHLPADALAEVLPALRPADDAARRLTRGEAIALLSVLGSVGGNRARPGDALEWASRARKRRQEFEAELATAQAAARNGDTDTARRCRKIERLVSDLKSLGPALDALVRIARAVIERADLSTLWPMLGGFFEQSLLQPADGPRVQLVLRETLGDVAADRACRVLAGDEALRLVEEALLSARVPAGRFGDPAVYVGSLAEAAGLPFTAVRVIGLAEGHMPPSLPEDPVIPDALREHLRTRGVPVPAAADRVLEKLHAFDAAVRNARRRIALSAPRLDFERSQREPSSVVLEAAAALARPNRTTGEPAAVIPDRTALRRDGFAAARQAAIRFRRGLPLTESAWLDGVAQGAFGIPRRWIPAGAASSGHGTAAPDLAVPGLSPDRPISPSGIEKLLRCPRGFLLRSVLGFDEPPALPTQLEIGQPAYGDLFHTVAADFFRDHGTAFCARCGSLAYWLGIAEGIVDCRFEEFIKGYALAADTVRRQQREQLRRDLRELLAFEWGSAPATRFLAVEKPFGLQVPVPLKGNGATLYLTGRIDRIDVRGPVTLIRDYKTSRAHRRLGREAGPQPVVDAQIAVYGLVAATLAEEWDIPHRIGAGYVYVGRGAVERSFQADFHETLAPAARGWLEVAAALLAQRAFPRTPEEDDCARCCFRPLCGAAEQEPRAELPAGSQGLVDDFTALRAGRLED